MTPAYARGGGVLLIAAAIVAWAWCLDQSDKNLGLRQSLERISTQVERLERSAAPAAAANPANAPADPAPSVARMENAQQVRLSAAGFGSDARNLAAALQRTKQMCLAAKLAECQVRRATSFTAVAGGAAADAPGACRRAEAGPAAAAVAAASASASAPMAAGACQLTPYAVTVTAAFDPKGARDLLARLRDAGFLYRLQRINILLNRIEIDVVFFHSADIRADQTAGMKSAADPARSNRGSGGKP